VPAAGAATPAAATETAGRPQRRLSWRRARLWAKRGFAWSATLSTLLVAFWFVWLVAEAALRPNSIDLDAIQVPKPLADNGFSSPVVSSRLRDAIKDLQDRAKTSMKMTSVDALPDLSRVTVPKAGVSVESIAASIRDLLPTGWRHEVSGEFTLADTRLTLRLRLNGLIVFTDSETGPEAADRLIERGAYRIVDKTQPYVIASALFETDPAAAKAAADRIIASLPPKDKNVTRAYNLRGMIAYKHGKTDEAIAEYREAIRLDQKDALPHNNLGVIWKEQGKTDDAIGEFREAIRLDQKLAGPHNNIGNIWDEQGKTDYAIAEYREAIRLDSKYPDPHYNLGLALRSLASAGTASDRPARLQAACAEFTQGAKLAPNDPDYPARMKDIDALLQGEAHCPPE
jgi:hypothetical protein